MFENSFSTNPESQTITEGDTLLLFCIHRGSVPPATITWTRNGNVIQTSSRVHVQSSVLSHTNPPQVTSTLAISPTATSDSGRYRCVATNTVLPGSNVLSQQANITVRGEEISMVSFPCQIDCSLGMRLKLEGRQMVACELKNSDFANQECIRTVG